MKEQLTTRFQEDRTDYSFAKFRCNLCTEDIYFSSHGATAESIEKDLLEHIINCDIKIRGEDK
jgi:hypothetical protein